MIHTPAPDEKDRFIGSLLEEIESLHKYIDEESKRNNFAYFLGGTMFGLFIGFVVIVLSGR